MDLSHHRDFILIAMFITSLKFWGIASAHGTINHPVPRGLLNNHSSLVFEKIDKNAPSDPYPHFPSGNKSNVAYAGRDSQRDAAGPNGWTIFDPFHKGFVWRAGVCGDMIPPHPQDHRKGGMFYHHGTIVGTYNAGDVLSVGLSINGHHNGFMMLHLCNVSKCPDGDISESCFTIHGACIELKRSKNHVCDNGWSKLCGPIDRNYPGRWYFPCTAYPRDDITADRWGFGVSQTILYDIPSWFTCKHCVLQWYWVSANNCNPPGVIDYYEGPDRPRAWEKCFGQGGARGGYNPNLRSCGKSSFPEEYYVCSDIKINPSKPIVYSSDKDLITSAQLEDAKKRSSGCLRVFVLIVGGVRHTILGRYNHIDARAFTWVAIEVIAEPHVREVSFSIDGVAAGFSNGPRFYPTGSKASSWGALIFNRKLRISASACGTSKTIYINLQKQ